MVNELLFRQIVRDSPNLIPGGGRGKWFRLWTITKISKLRNSHLLITKKLEGHHTFTQNSKKDFSLIYNKMSNINFSK
jgi:hypothetical protein